ncbi:LOW QUALITY PROTEIN: trihelix transcription factor GTL2-like [Juglans microcarpa x Juglans regia]|uniref:LOW QUALITY PROTEIN: trihelix transcription factor GTL2-like n=1 Tax=Juglans microcarpa x Juglans regia TaxID=2249226 RepID=UPI001B7E30D0|nr:LOW QUALITY PROTEIN: trihelix transcription factor GTL2-like [Juglans microcarpa x Juglans regia]
MFDGAPDHQFHQWIASRTTLPSLSPSFPVPHAFSSPNIFPSYDHYDPSLSLPPNLLHPLHQQSPTHKLDHQEQKQENNLVSMNLDTERQRSLPDPIESWANEEVLALLRIRSGMENWFPEFTWEHVSRKLAEVGFKRSPSKCKEKFEEESRYFNDNINYNKSYRFLSELEELYQGHDHQNPRVGAGKNQRILEKPSGGEDNLGQSNLEVDSRDGTVGNKRFEDSHHENLLEKSKRKKRKRRKKFEMLKGLCEKIVIKIMAQQEEMHNKLLEDMVKRDEEKVAKEEAWKKQALDRMNKELEIMANEQAIAGVRQATIIEYFKQLTSSSLGSHCVEERAALLVHESLKVTTSSNSYPSSSSCSLIQAPNHNHRSLSTQVNSITPTSITKTLSHQNTSPALSPNTPDVPTSSSLPMASRNPNSINTQKNPLTLISTRTQKVSQDSITNVKDNHGKRWPRDEVLALINMRCSTQYNNSNGGDQDKEGIAKAPPLWERISQGMLELGYKRSAKRCKEKWENINKYFKKTKDVNKKRSLDSRTCPYFHQLSTLYMSQGTSQEVAAPSEGPENILTT